MDKSGNKKDWSDAISEKKKKKKKKKRNRKEILKEGKDIERRRCSVKDTLRAVRPRPISMGNELQK